MAQVQSGRAEIASRLREAGYKLVQLQRSVEGAPRFRPDFLAFALNEDGALVPWLVVELSDGAVRHPELALPQLAKARELLGTVEHYAIVDGQWWRADRSLRSFERADGPPAPQFGVDGVITDESLATSLLMDRMWYEADQQRADGDSRALPSTEPFEDRGEPGFVTTSGDLVRVAPEVLWTARRRALAAYSARSRFAEQHATPEVVAQAIAGLLGEHLYGTVLDPMCGIGNFLWSAMDAARKRSAAAEFVGYELSPDIGAVAAKIAQTAPLPAKVILGDSFVAHLPTADAIVCAPPFGVLNGRDYVLLDGSPARDYESAALDLCLRNLREGGRAVLLVPAGFTFKRALNAYRRFVSEQFHVGALIGLPAGVFSSGSVRMVVIVIDRTEPGTTFVAQLGEDWQSQLAEGGAALEAAREHLDSRPRRR